MNEEQERLYVESIKLLKKDGTRFTVDDLSSILHMSKKTLYSFFSSKEELASWIYDEAFRRYDLATKKRPFEIKDVFLTYADLLNILDTNTFNRYSLNDSLKASSLQEGEQKRKDLRVFLNLTPYQEKMKHPSFFLSLEASLLAFSKRPDEEKMIEDYINFLG